MPQRIFSLCLTLALALACCLLAPGANAEAPSPEEVKALLAEAEAGDFQAQFELGELYAGGSGVPKNDKKAVDWYRKAAEQGHAEAMDNLGWMYEDGRGVPKNVGKAAYWFRRAVEAGREETRETLGAMYAAGRGLPKDDDVEGMYDAGRIFAEGIGTERDDARAVHWFRKAAEKDHAEAWHSLGRMYERGEGVPQNGAEAMKCYRKAAEQGYAEAWHSLGRMYELGEIVPKDEVEALKCYRKAAGAGRDGEAAKALDAMYAEGRGVPADPAEAAAYWREAALRDHVEAQYRVAREREEAGDREEAARWRVAAARNGHEAALAWLRDQAEKGDAEMRCTLAWMYEHGRGLPKDEAEAAAWYRRAAEQGHYDALFHLGKMYEEGRGVPKDDGEAAVWYRKAAEQDHTGALCKMGDFSLEGRGVAQDDREAVRWLRKCSFGAGKKKLDTLYAAGRGAPEDAAEAAEYWREAAKRGNAEGQYRAARDFERAGDMKQAMDWCLKAAEQGHEAAGAWFDRAMEAGEARALFLASLKDRTVKGAPLDPDQAATLRRQAAEAGDVDAMYAMARLAAPDEVEGERAEPRDYATAALWYRKAAEQGHVGAMRKMGRLCEAGLGVPRNVKEAADWYAGAVERIARAAFGKEGVSEDVAEFNYRGALMEVENDLYRLRGGVVFQKYRMESNAESALLTVVIDYPVDGDPKGAAAMRKAVDALLGGCSHWAELKLKPGKATPKNFQARLDALGKGFAKLPEDVTGYGVTYVLHIEVAHQGPKTVTFTVQDSSFGNGGPMPPGFVTVRKSDGGIVESREMFNKPQTKTPAPKAEDDDGEEEVVDAAGFVARALKDGYRVGAVASGMMYSAAKYRTEEPLFASWAEIEPFLTPQARELFAEHLNKGK